MRSRLLLLALVAALFGPAQARPNRPSLNLQPPIPETELVSPPGQAVPEQPLRLATVLSQVEQTHPKLRGAALARQIAEAKVLEKLGAFDASVGTALTYQRYNSSSTPGKAVDYISNGVVVAKTDPSGIKWEGGWLNTQGFPKSPVSSTGDIGEFFVQAKVPLLRGAGINDKSVEWEKARLVQRQVEQDYQIVRLLTLLDAGSAFLRWNVAIMQWRILRENEELAVERAQQVAKRVEAGDLAAIDRVEAEAEVSKRRELLLKAGREGQKAALKLALYLWQTEGQPSSVPVPEMAPQDFAPPRRLGVEDVQQIQLEALAHRPELRWLNLERSIISWDKSLAEQDRLPQLDLALRPGYDAGSQGIGFTVKAGLELIIPLGTRGPDGRRQAALLKLEKLDLQQVETLRGILIQVQDTASEAEAAAERLIQGELMYQQSKTLEEAERLKFRLGDSTLFLVNARERATLEAALKVLDLRYEHAQAMLLLDAVAGRL